jgi:hypothetical protein
MSPWSHVEKRIMKRGRGHWCWSCQQTKPNEAFSGRNHGRHLCRMCASHRRRAAREKRKVAIAAGPVAMEAHPAVTGHDANRPVFAVTRGSAWVDPGDGSDNYAPALLPDLLEMALALSDNDRTFLTEYLIATLPADPQWLAELECRARRALTDPECGDAWEMVAHRLARRVARR